MSEGDSNPTSRAASKGHIGELTVVFGISVGIPLTLSLLSSRGSDFGQERLLITIIEEVVLFSVLWLWLRRRGWSFGPIVGSPGPIDILRALGLVVATYVAYYISATVWVTAVPGGLDQLKTFVPIGSAPAWTIALVAIINPIVEECLWLAYGFTALERFGATAAIAISVGLRVLIHTYQGAMALVGILPLGLVFTIYFARTRRIWPVIVAHMLFDTIGLLSVLRK